MASFAANTYHAYPDDQLVSALWDGDRGAFADIYDRYWQSLYRLAYPKELAEAIVQDLFVSL